MSKRSLLYPLLGIGLAAIGLLAGKSRLYEKLGYYPLRFPYKESSLSDSDRESLRRAGVQLGSFATGDGATLTTLLRAPKTRSDDCTILFFPGNDEHPLLSAEAFLAKLDPERRCTQASFAPRGYDSSTGTPSPQHQKEDVAAFLGALAGELGRSKAVHLVGFSLGTFASFPALSKLTTLGIEAKSVTLLAPARGLSMLQPNGLGRFMPGDQYAMGTPASAWHGQLCIVAGTSDEAFHGPGEARALASRFQQLLPGRFSYVELQGVGHEALLHSEAAHETIRAMIALPAPARAPLVHDEKTLSVQPKN